MGVTVLKEITSPPGVAHVKVPSPVSCPCSHLELTPSTRTVSCYREREGKRLSEQFKRWSFVFSKDEICASVIIKRAWCRLICALDG